MLQIKPLPEELQKVAIAELGEVPERIPQDLQDLKTWIEQQPHLKARTDDQFLVQFLRGCKYSLEKAKQKIDQFYSLRSKHPEMCSVTDVDEPTFRKLHNTRSCSFLPTPLNGSGPRICLFQLNYSAEVFNTTDIFNYLASCFEVQLMSDPYFAINGLVLVQDCAKSTPGYLRLLTPTFIMNLYTYFEKTFPVRIKAVYIINVSNHLEKLFKVLLQCLPEKINKRVFICGSNIDGLPEQFPKKFLPREYGGENGSVDDLCAEYSKVLDEYREYFQQNAEFGTDERLRLGKPFDSDGELGCGGSFRKLNVD